MQRYAVLRDLRDPERRPIGLITEHADRVRAFYAADCGLRSEYTGAYDVLEPDGGIVRYEPGRGEYFDHVLLSLSRAFLVSELESVETIDPEEIYRLYYVKVDAPRRARAHEYVGGTRLLADSYEAPEREPADNDERSGRKLSNLTAA